MFEPVHILARIRTENGATITRPLCNAPKWRIWIPERQPTCLVCQHLKRYQECSPLYSPEQSRFRF